MSFLRPDKSVTPKTFPARLGLASVELEVFQGFVFVRLKGDGPSVAATAAASASMVATAASPPAAFAARPAAIASAADAAASASPQSAYGVDIGSGLTIQALRARWEVLRSAHPQLFEGLQPIVSVKEVPRGSRVELRLVAGPLAQPRAATQLCAQLTPFGLFCQPTFYDGQRLAWR